MVSTEPYNAVAEQTREAAEKSAEAWRAGAVTLADPAERLFRMQMPDLTQPVASYFEYLHESADLHRELANKWAELVASFTGLTHGQSGTGHLTVASTVDAPDEHLIGADKS